MSYIKMAEAKKQIAKIDSIIDKPLILIGGIAVSHYVLTRQSQDIDIVCTDDMAKYIISELYPTEHWNQIDLQEDEYRPSIQIRHKTKKDYPAIIFGPKVLERGFYPHIGMDEMMDGSVPFKYQKQIYENIRIPSVECLCYLKILSFLGRDEDKIGKLKQDLNDIKNLCNQDDFRLGVFLNLINTNNMYNQIKQNFYRRLLLIDSTFEGCNLFSVSRLFEKEDISATITPQRNKGLIAFDVDGTLIKGIRHSWTLLWNEIGISDAFQRRNKTAFQEGKLSYVEWTQQDCNVLQAHKLTQENVKHSVTRNSCTLTKNLIPAIQRLKEMGFIVAIVSGGVDAVLYALLPNADDLFDDIYINRFKFNKDTGILESISPTEYDWDDNKLGVAGKNRGLERLCEKYSIPIERSIFVGDDINDIKAMTLAGTKVYYCTDTKQIGGAQLPEGVIMVPENDLMKLVDEISTLPHPEVL